MEALTFSHVRANLTEVMRRVNDDRAPVVVTSQRGKPVVIMALDDFNALEETAYLLRNPKGAKRLLDSIAQVQAGTVTEHKLIDDADQVL
ncbi:MAG: type II toxin-antitoxin system prevent-host-death family antitoxin [Ideonella sp.]